LIHCHPPERFRALRERRLEKRYQTADIRERHRDQYDLEYPSTHRYNCIAGLAGVYWDGGTRILVEAFFRGDRRTAFGKAVAYGRRAVRSTQLYPLYVQPISAGEFPHPSCQEELKRKAIMDGLKHIERTTADLGAFVDLTAEKALVDAFDLNRLLS